MFNTSELSRSALSPFTPRNASRRSISSPVQPSRLFPRSARSNTQSQRSFIPARVIDETPLHRVETYGLAAPVQVNEIVAATNERTAPVSIHLDPSGWAWLVFERRLLVWRYHSTEKSKATFCKEFVLPPTELYHSAKLVCLVGAPGGDSRQFGVLAVSPEGLVCYWPSMMYESSPVETETELVGQEFHSLIEFQPHGYILSTTTNDILLLSVQKKSISFHRFRQPGGVLSGFGRRMSSFIFGAEEATSSVLRKIVVEKTSQGSSRAFYVLSGNTLRKWSVENQSGSISEKTEADWNVGALFERQTSQRFQVGLDKVKSFCIDAEDSSSGISVLSAMLVQNPEIDEARMYYFLGTIDVDEDSDTFGRFISFVQLRFAEEYKEELHQGLVDFQLLIPANSKHAFLYSENIIVPFSIRNTDEALNKVEFLAEDDRIWGSGSSEDAALFFVRKHGIVNITAKTNAESESETMSPSTTRQVGPDTSVQADKASGLDNLTALRTAFLQFCQGNKDEAQTMCEEQFEDITRLEGVSSLDAVVVDVSQEIVDDYPASDPRWAEAVPTDSASSSASLIIIHQLEDKLKAHDYFVQFLKEVFLFQKLTTVQQFGRIVNTRYLLCSRAEKLKFAIALRRQHNKYQDLVDGAIEVIMKHRDLDSAPKGLTQQDLFYREVSRISDVISGLLEYEKHRLSQQPTQQDYQEIIMAVNSILESTLREAWQYRQANEEQYATSRDEEITDVEFLPWTASSGPEGARTLLLEQLEISRERAFPLAEDQKTKAVLVQQLVDLSDILLDGYITQLNSLRSFDDQSKFEETNQKYERDRHQVIYPLVSRGYFEEALSLAEKYRDFDILIEICESLQDQDKLQHYMNLFNTENFSDFAFKWYMDRGKRSKLMTQPTTQHENLSKFLSSHDHLKWLHDIERQSFYQAFDTLKDLSGKEDLYLGRKKTLLSLAKLALLASDESEEDETIQLLEDITNQQTLITHQETIPAEVLQSVSVDPVEMPPLSPEQLIELYISDVNTNRDESDFKKALDVLHIAYTDDAVRDQYETLRLRIWSQAILADDWSNLQADDPIMVARNTMFFKTVEIALHQGFDLTVYMPSLENFMNCEELKTAGLTDNPTFQFLLRAGYEQILRTQNGMEIEI